MSRSLVIRETQARDREAALGVVAAAFARENEARLVEAMWREDVIALDLVADEGGEIAGHCVFSVVTAEPSLKGAALGLAPLAVSPARQRSGIGSALVETGLDICRTRGASLIVVVGEPAYYARFGFSPGSAQNISWAAYDAGAAFQIIDWSGVGDAKRKIHYHPLFSET